MVHFWLGGAGNIRSKVCRIYEECYISQINATNSVYDVCVIIYPVLSRSDKSNWLASQEEVCTIFAYQHTLFALGQASFELP